MSMPSSASVDGREIKFSDMVQLQPKQLEVVRALDGGAKYLFFGGAAGGGKSHGIRWIMLRFLLKWAAPPYNQHGVRVMIGCKDYPRLNERQLTKIAREFPSYLGTMNKAAREFVLKDRFGGGVIAFRNLDDVEKYASAEFAAIAIDEMTENPYETFTDLRWRLRWPGIPSRELFFLMSGNPMGPGIGWVKKYFIDRQFEPNDDPSQFHFIQSKVYDNKYIDADYIAMMKTLPEDQRRALLDGDWDVFKGQAFSEWSRSIHVVEPFQIQPGLGSWYVSLDWGYTDPSSVGLWWHSPWGKLYRVREIYEKGLRPSELAGKIRAMVGLLPIKAYIADPSIFTKGPETRQSIGEILYQYGGMQFLPAVNDRIPGWQRLKEWLRPFDESVESLVEGIPQLSWRTTAMLQVFSTCKDFIRTLPNMIYDEKHPEDIVTRGVEDHPADDGRYMIMYLPVLKPNRVGQTGSARPSWMTSRGEIVKNNAWREAHGFAVHEEEDFDDDSAGW